MNAKVSWAGKIKGLFLGGIGRWSRVSCRSIGEAGKGFKVGFS